MPIAATTEAGPTAAIIFFSALALVFVAQGVKQAGRRKRLDALLERSFAYYRDLDSALRSEFRERVERFVEEKDFHGRSIIVTREMEQLLAACAVQLTFGLPWIGLSHFTRIIVYPDRYRSRSTGADHVGEVNPGMRAIVISWKRFRNDYDVPDDARNLGLHEMAHALWFENRIPNDEHDFLDRRSMATWRALAQEEAARIHAGKSRLFRDYAGTDQEEFFAVAVEYFFERPNAFRAELPELYRALSAMLQQDPASKIGPLR